ncbi:MAG: DUF2203 domain-containing protein [Actinomycetota bacterium]
MSEVRYTVEEANALLPRLGAMLERLRDAQRVMAERHDQVMEATTHNGGGGPGKEFLEASQEAGKLGAEIQVLGIVVRDPETGLIDFPSERDGEEIYLCWRLGEDAVGWWHPTDTGFAGRQPL